MHVNIRTCLILVLTFVSLVVYSQQVANANVDSRSVVEARIKALDALTPMELVYNRDVQAYIDVYTVRRPDHLARILGRSELYFPLFEEYLAKHGLPLELKYLAVVESALDPRARSTSGAVGLWQFLFHAARMVNLEVTSYIDERKDPVKSTEAAARYLKYLYSNFHDWNLAMASYNGGIATVKEAIFKSGGQKDFWKIRQHLSAETRAYVPAFIAVVYVMNYYKYYNITPVAPEFEFDDLGIIYVDKSTSFTQLARIMDTKSSVLLSLNPVYLRDFVPVGSEPVRLLVPRINVPTYFLNRHQLVAENGPPVVRLPAIGDKRGKVKTVHEVARGEFFHTIAINYGCRVEDIQKWNGIKSRELLAGQKLIIWHQPVEEPCILHEFTRAPLTANN